MKGRALVVVLALILATLATVGVFMYARGVQEDAKSGGTLVPVVVSKVEIPARTDLDALIKDDQFKFIQVPETAVVGGAITSLDQLSGKTNAAPILAGEQIPNARISGNISGGVLSIPPGMQALNVALEAPRAIAGVLAAGDNVTVYGTYTDVTDIKTEKKLPTFTSILVPTVEVLAVYRPSSGTTSITGNEEETTQQPDGTGTVSVTLALTEKDAQKFVFTLETAHVWLGLLPPGETGEKLSEVTLLEVIE